ncbi:MAG: acetylglutamate kinase [Christensenellales bacterium]
MFLKNNQNASQLYWTNALRKLWAEHVFWTRAFLVSTATDQKDRAFVTKRLLRNPIDFATVLKPVFGAQKTQKFQNLLTEHLVIAAQFVGAAKAGDTKGAEEYKKKWYQNADEIAAYMHEMNPNWDMKDWQTMLYDHLKLTGDEAAQILSGQYAASINQFDVILQQAMEMADSMAAGIVKKLE